MHTAPVINLNADIPMHTDPEVNLNVQTLNSQTSIHIPDESQPTSPKSLEYKTIKSPPSNEKVTINKDIEQSMS